VLQYGLSFFVAMQKEHVRIRKDRLREMALAVRYGMHAGPREWRSLFSREARSSPGRKAAADHPAFKTIHHGKKLKAERRGSRPLRNTL
jgi:hypothetical protein